jgi:hypothetical protein
MNDEQCRFRIKNHNIEASFANIKLLFVTNLICAMLMSINIILFMLNK